MQKLLDLSKLNTITVTTFSVGETSQISRQIVDLLRTRHKINQKMPDDFTVRTEAALAIGHGLPPTVARVLAGNMEDVDKVTIGRIADSLKRANSTMLSLLAGVAAVSLLVGGIGIMNILLLSVTERTREIGLRMALGARRTDVITQFVAEAVLLSIVGGLLGTAVGCARIGEPREVLPVLHQHFDAIERARHWGGGGARHHLRRLPGPARCWTGPQSRHCTMNERKSVPVLLLSLFAAVGVAAAHDGTRVALRCAPTRRSGARVPTMSCTTR